MGDGPPYLVRVPLDSDRTADSSLQVEPERPPPSTRTPHPEQNE